MEALALIPSALPVPFGLLADGLRQRNLVAWSGYPPKLSIPASAFEVARRKYQAHHRYGSKDNENDGFHGVTSWYKRIKWHSHSALGPEETSCE